MRCIYDMHEHVIGISITIHFYWVRFHFLLETGQIVSLTLTDYLFLKGNWAQFHCKDLPSNLNGQHSSITTPNQQDNKPQQQDVMYVMFMFTSCCIKSCVVVLYAAVGGWLIWYWTAVDLCNWVWLTLDEWKLPSLITPCSCSTEPDLIWMWNFFSASLLTNNNLDTQNCLLLKFFHFCKDKSVINKITGQIVLIWPIEINLRFLPLVST